MGNNVLALVFQGGKRVNGAIPATAGNVAYAITPPAGKRWLFIRGHITLVCDANAGNRSIRAVVNDGTNTTEGIMVGSNVTANNTGYMSFGEVRQYDDIAGLGSLSTMGYVGIDPILLEGDDELSIYISSGLAGDSFSGNYTVLEL